MPLSALAAMRLSGGVSGSARLSVTRPVRQAFA